MRISYIQDIVGDKKETLLPLLLKQERKALLHMLPNDIRIMN